MELQRLTHRYQRLVFGRNVQVWYDPSYRLPLSSLEGQTGFEPRRADFTAWYLIESQAIPTAALQSPQRANYRQLGRVHTAEYLESLSHPRTLARIFAVDESDVLVDELLASMRMACGATLAAAHSRLKDGGIALNLFGGFHHAGPEVGGGFCALNDIAVAVADLRESGFTGQVVVLDLDAHPPDGLAACFQGDPSVWVGSLSGCDWGRLDGVDETVLPVGCDDTTYLRALEGLLARMPKPDFAFVIAGGDVLAGDRLGKLGLTLEGVRQRDLRVVRKLAKVPSVWLPGGGYNRRSWLALAGTALVLTCRSLQGIPGDYDPMRSRFSWLAATLNREKLAGAFDDLSTDDLEEELGVRSARRQRLLGYYSAEGLEYALTHYGLLPHLRRLGYEQFRTEVEQISLGDCLRLYGTADGQSHLLIELVVERKRVADTDMLYVHWLTLRNARARFSPLRPQLPGQEYPGLGLAREMGWVLARIARRLGLSGVAFRPAWYHTAYTARYHFVFVDPTRQGRFEAMLRDLKDYPLVEVTQAASQGRLQLNNEPYTWEADEMAFWLGPSRLDEKAVEAERNRAHFRILPDPSLS